MTTPVRAFSPDHRDNAPDRSDAFENRHIGPDSTAITTMLATLGYDSLDALTDAAVPDSIRLTRPLDLPPALSEPEALAELRALADRNVVATSLIGQGYYDTVTPAVIRRGVLESPAWYTAYTPYQPEISQGRLEALLNFQTVISDLTGLEIAGASLLDEATAVAEAVALMVRAGARRPGAAEGVVLVDDDVFLQTRRVVEQRAQAAGYRVVVTSVADGFVAARQHLEASGALAADAPILGIVLQHPGSSGVIRNLAPVIDEAKADGALVTIATDLLALTLLASPAELGADVAVGSSQRFGVPMFYGGPHAAFMAVRQGLERSMPGRLVGVSVDVEGAPAYRLALQTREQHIRREKATSNICTAQALLAITASMYAVYHGPQGLTAIAERVQGHAVDLANRLAAAGLTVVHDVFFDTIRVRAAGHAETLRAAAEAINVNLYVADADHVQISLDETTTSRTVAQLVAALSVLEAQPAVAQPTVAQPVPMWAARTSSFLTHPVFHLYHNETAMMRYLRRLSDKDLALDRTMIPLGSCTMKLNSAIEMEPISWPGFANIHPFAPAHQTAGYAELIDTLEHRLAEITGYAAVSVQPNAGSQGEFAGLLAVRRYQIARGQEQRDICLIPASAHGTNAASATMAGLRVVVVATAEDGAINLDDLRAKLAEHGDRVAAIMITYPSTHGVYEEGVRTVCELVHAAGGQVYIDGANLNALVGLAKPGEFGGDVSHLNLHKTFAIPHGGGGPGVGPIGVAAHLVEFLPGDPRDDSTAGPVSAADFGSAGVLPISYAYLALMGPEGLRRASQVAVLSANYLAARVQDAFPVLYTGPHGLVAHECILDLRDITARTGVTAEDVAKRLMDYGFHAPTLSFPVAGTLMVEPTESEDLTELDRFIDALLSIRQEIDQVAAGVWTAEESPLRGAPHTAACVTADVWDRAYSRAVAAYPSAAVRTDKYWPPVRRIDGARGDRNLICSCPPMENYHNDDVRNAR